MVPWPGADTSLELVLVALRMGTAGEAGYRKGSPFGFCNTPRAQQGNPIGPKRKVAAVGLGKTRNPIFSLKMGNPRVSLRSGAALEGRSVTSPDNHLQSRNTRAM